MKVTNANDLLHRQRLMLEKAGSRCAQVSITDEFCIRVTSTSEPMNGFDVDRFKPEPRIGQGGVKNSITPCYRVVCIGNAIEESNPLSMVLYSEST